MSEAGWEYPDMVAMQLFSRLVRNRSHGPHPNHQLPLQALSIWAELSSSPNEVISSPVMGLTVSVTGAPAAYPSDTNALSFEM